MKKRINTIQDSDEIRQALLFRKKELDLTLAEIVMDARVRGMKIIIGSLSRYFNDSEENNLTEASIRWLACRYGVKIDVSVDLENPFDDKKAIEELKIKFPNGKRN